MTPRQEKGWKMAGKDKKDFWEEAVDSWENLMREIQKIQKLGEGKWMYRGQTSDQPLKTPT